MNSVEDVQFARLPPSVQDLLDALEEAQMEMLPPRDQKEIGLAIWQVLNDPYWSKSSMRHG